MKVRIARAAERDLEGIGDWIGAGDLAAAARFVDELREKAQQIADIPFAFPAVTSRSPGGLRKRSYRRYIIYYRVGRNTVTIIRILRHSRDQVAQLRKT